MEDQELKKLWQANDSKLEKLMTINLSYLESVQQQKIRSAFRPLLVKNTLSLIFGIMCVLFFSTFVFAHLNKPFMILSGGLLLALSILHSVTCIAHLNIISQMEYSHSVIDLQEKLAMFQSWSARYARLALFMFPLHLACQLIFFEIVFKLDLTQVANKSYWIANLIVCLLFLIPTLWLYKKLTADNMHIKWVRNLIGNSSGETAVLAMELLREIDLLRKE